MQDTTSAQTTSTRFWLIFWGLLLVIGDINVMGIDILPDFVGYLLVALGCAGLSSASRGFVTAGALSWVLFALALAALMDNLMPDRVATGLKYAELAVHAAMIWFLLGGVMEMAAARQRTGLSQRASQYRIAYIVLMCLATLAGIVEGPAVVMGVVAVICILTLLVLILHLLYRAGHELAASPAL